LLKLFDKTHGDWSDEYELLTDVMRDGLSIPEVQALSLYMYLEVRGMTEGGELARLDGLRLQAQLLESMRKMAPPKEAGDGLPAMTEIHFNFGADGERRRGKNRGPGVTVE
jgi:hypothetical protein